VVDAGIKALFVILTILRDLSPGFKPPVIFMSRIRLKNSQKEITVAQPGSVLEPASGQLEPCAGSDFFRPKAIDGSIYARGAVHMPDELLAPKPLRDRTNAYHDAFWAVPEPFYRSSVGPTVAEHLGYLKDYEEALRVVKETQRCAANVELDFMETFLEVIEVRCLLSLRRIDEAKPIISRATERETKRGRAELAATLPELLKFPPLWGKTLQLGSMTMGRPPDAAPLFFLELVTGRKSDPMEEITEWFNDLKGPDSVS
jgi:hypothetical protein